MDLDVAAGEGGRAVEVGFGADAEGVGGAGFAAVVDFDGEAFGLGAGGASDLGHAGDGRVSGRTAGPCGDEKSVDGHGLDPNIVSMVVVLEVSGWIAAPGDEAEGGFGLWIAGAKNQRRQGEEFTERREERLLSRDLSATGGFAGRVFRRVTKILKTEKDRSIEGQGGEFVSGDPAVLVSADGVADDVRRIAQRPHTDGNARGIPDGHVHREDAEAVVAETVFEGVPAFDGDRAGHSAGIFGEGTAAARVVAGANDEARAGAGGIRVGVKSGVKNEVAPVAALRCANGGGPVKPGVVCIARAVHVGSRDIQVNVDRCGVAAGRKCLARAAPESICVGIAVEVFGMESANLRRHTVRAGHDSRGAGPSGGVRFKTLEEHCRGLRRGDTQQDRGKNCGWPGFGRSYPVRFPDYISHLFPFVVP